MLARVLPLSVIVLACGSPTTSTPDAEVADAGRPDAAVADARPAPDAELTPDAHVHPRPDAIPADAGVIDAIPAPDAGPPTVFPIACPATPRVTVIVGQGSYAFFPDDGTPDDEYTIAAGDIVRFETSPVHDVASGTSGAETDEFFVDVDTIACRQFTAPGTFPFYCTLHGFDAVLIVE